MAAGLGVGRQSGKRWWHLVGLRASLAREERNSAKEAVGSSSWRKARPRVCRVRVAPRSPEGWGEELGEEGGLGSTISLVLPEHQHHQHLVRQRWRPRQEVPPAPGPPGARVAA